MLMEHSRLRMQRALEQIAEEDTRLVLSRDWETYGAAS